MINMGFFTNAKQKIQSGVKTVQDTHSKIQAAKEQRAENELNRINQKIKVEKARGKLNKQRDAAKINLQKQKEELKKLKSKNRSAVPSLFGDPSKPYQPTIGGQIGTGQAPSSYTPKIGYPYSKKKRK